jgi:hypothetical protein
VDDFVCVDLPHEFGQVGKWNHLSDLNETAHLNSYHYRHEIPPDFPHLSRRLRGPDTRPTEIET